jgi:hypothetical protein
MDEEIDLQKRIARQIADQLAATVPDEPALFRLCCAHEAAKGIVSRAKDAGTIEDLRYNLSRLEASDYSI